MYIKQYTHVDVPELISREVVLSDLGKIWEFSGSHFFP